MTGRRELGAPIAPPADPDRHHLEDSRLIAREAGGAGAAQVAKGVLRYAGAFFAVRILGAPAFGAYTLALAVTGLGATLSGLGFSPGLLPFISRAKRAGEPARFGALLRTSSALVIGAAIAVSCAVFLGAPWLSEAVFRNPELSGVLRAISPLVFIGALVGLLGTFLQGFIAVKERAWIEGVLVTALTVVGLAVSWMFGWGWPGVIVATLAGPAAGVVCAAVVLARRAPGALRPSDPFPPKELLAHCWPLLGTSLLMFSLMWSDILILGALRDAREVGIYSLCARLAAGVVVFQESIGQIFTPRLSDLFVTGNRGAMQSLYHVATRWSIWPTMVAGALLLLWGREILGLFGSDFTEGAALLAVLGVARVVGVCAGMSGRIFAVTGRGRLQLLDLILMLTLNVVLNLLLIPAHGAMGAAVATLASVAAVNALQVIQVAALLRILPWDRRTLVPIVGVTVLTLVAFPFRGGPDGSLGWLVPLSVFVAVSAGLFLVWGAAEEEKDVWRAARERLGSRIER